MLEMQRFFQERIHRPEESVGPEGITFRVIVHPLKSGAIVVNYPGFRHDIDGYNGRYTQIADFLTREKIGAVVRVGNHMHMGLDYASSMVGDLKAVLEYALSNAEKICGSPRPDIFVMGFSAGAGAVAAVLSDFPQIKKALLMVPSQDAYPLIEPGLRRYSGELYIAIAAADEVVGIGPGMEFYHTAGNARVKEFAIIPDCDHEFSGEINGKYLSSLPIWAFSGRIKQPAPEHGIRLYD